MSEKKPSYRVNFTMPQSDSELNGKINELFERHREIGTLRHWLMSLATEAARKELEIVPTSSNSISESVHTPTKLKKVESVADLIPDNSVGNKAIPKRAKSKELEAYDRLIETIRNEDGYDPNENEYEKILEGARPLMLSDY